MKVSYKWLKQLVDLEGISFDELVRDLSLYSIEVEGTEKVTDASNIIVAYVESIEDHPDSDHLHVCKVNTGSEILQIVCGAPNVDKGQKIMLALPGAVLPGGTIKQAKVRGVESNGMICSLAELGLESKYVPEKYANGIYVLDDDAPLGASALEYLELNDEAIELGLTPNRMDLLSMNGVANDVSAMYSRERIYEYEEANELDKAASEEVSVKLETEDCLSYYAKVIKDVEIKESPNFIKARLIASGIRPINNVVDITNYILVLFGQPLHAFDQDVLGDKIVVRCAKPGEKAITLDEQERTLTENDIVITDGEKVTCIAGVMGCANSGVSDTTKNIVLESAVFKPLSVRKTSARLGLRSESSVRYERGVDLNQTILAANYACYLLEKYAGGKVLKGSVHEGIVSVPSKKISLTENEVEKYLGVNIKTEEIIEICKKLGFYASGNKDEINIEVPNRRLDITIKQDVIEEIARLHGYDKLNETLPKMDLSGALTPSQKMRRVIGTTLSELGLREVLTYTLVSSKFNEKFNNLYPNTYNEVKLLNPISEERSNVRLGLIPSLLEVVKYNKTRKNNDIHIFELSNRYYFDEDNNPQAEMILGLAMTNVFSSYDHMNKKEVVDFYTIKGIIETLFNRLGIKETYKVLENPCKELHPKRSAGIYVNDELVGFVGEIHPAYANKEDLDETYVCEINVEKLFGIALPEEMFKQISRLPAVERDLALVMNKDQNVGEIIEAIYRTDKTMIKNVTVFDIYTGEKLGDDLKSVAFRITLESDEVLTDEIITGKVNKIIKMAEFRYQAKLRS
ncbi:MAG: phenylalanine--tRNA ligase subunit beta [Bacilli bacterium]|nr:phenylalanine--tRNA ligase subunit beta [Bacilli bacterium]